MSFSRLSYDCCAYKKNIKQSEEPGFYQLYKGKYYNDNECRIQFGVIGGNEVSLKLSNLVDLESDLKGQTRVNTHCPQNKYFPMCKQPSTNGLPSGKNDCNNSDHLKTCNLICYKPIVYAPIPTVSICEGLYKPQKEYSNSVLKENFAECSIRNYDTYPKFTSLPGKPCPYSKPANIPQNCGNFYCI